MLPAFRCPLRAIFAFLVVLSNSAVFADGPASYVIHARLDMKDGTTKNGYFTLVSDSRLINRDEAGFYYNSTRSGRPMRLQAIDSLLTGVRPAKNDYHFCHDLLFTLRDSVWLYRDARAIDVATSKYPQDSPIAVLLGAPVKFLKSGIRYISVVSIQQIYAIAETKFTLEDGSWMKQRIVYRERIERYELCEFHAAGIKTPGATALTLLNDLRRFLKNFTSLSESEGYDACMAKQRSIIERLWQEGIIVFSYCSC